MTRKDDSPSLWFYLPRHNDRFGDAEVAAWDAKHGHLFPTSVIRSFAASPVRHNGCHEFDDIRARYKDGKARQHAKAIVKYREANPRQMELV